MLTKTLPTEETPPTPRARSEVLQEINEQVDERGFYLYEWITPDELRLSVKADYLRIVRASSIPLAVVTLIAGFIGLTGSFIGVFFAVLGVLGIFYAVVAVILIVSMIKKSYLYARGADVVITDNHYVSNGKIFQKDDFEGQKEAFRVMETIFREPLFSPSEMHNYVKMEQASLMDQLKMIASG